MGILEAGILKKVLEAIKRVEYVNLKWKMQDKNREMNDQLFVKFIFKQLVIQYACRNKQWINKSMNHIVN